ncbi:MAG: ribonuclease E/G [Pseudomonadota bacterium]|nr:ribonuclease E/G [Pseudomonadota bacterium]
MTTKIMLIDASHLEETRVAIVNGQQLEDFDVEVESRRQLRGNIYLAKVTRVEPSLQAAFVDYGGNRHGFLAFNEIHPDYYQIPVADREALVAEQQEAETKAEKDALNKVETESNEDTDLIETGSQNVETLGGDVVDDVQAERPVISKRRYKIQEVVKRRQILLIQVVKEERGTKGAALTTYLSLAGRYCVLMPNTARGGGISRKITNPTDRKRLKNILNDLSIPGVMAVIVRTAGQKRSKAEIKRDYEYLIRLWESLRKVTLESMAPCLVHEEGNLIKRSIRDLYDKEISEIIVDGDDGYRTAKDFMKLLIPSHTKRVQPFKETSQQLFKHFQVENQLGSMHSPNVQLSSGGYIVINPTEALVSIDVNSGRATKGRNIEETALKTNLEASDEIARQLKLRDLSGLIVIDYIDMEVSRNQNKVEHRLKDAMRSDRARIQIGRISPFGLLELSRQRMRPSLIETSSDPCPHCEGTGIRRSSDSAALHLLRAIKEEASNQDCQEITVYSPTLIALHIFNNQREALAEIEGNYNTTIIIETDDTLIPPSYRIEIDENKKESGKNYKNSKRIADDLGKRRRRRGRRRNEEKKSDIEISNSNNNNEASNKNAPKDTRQNNDEENSLGNANRRRRGRRGGRRRGRKPLDQSVQELDKNRNIKEVTPHSTPKTEHQILKPVIADKQIDIEKSITNQEPEKTNKKEQKKPTKRAVTKNLKKTDDKPTGKKDVNKSKTSSKPNRKSKTIKEKDQEKVKQTPAVFNEPDLKSAIPVAASAKTEVIAVGTEENIKVDNKKIRKGWWK